MGKIFGRKEFRIEKGFIVNDFIRIPLPEGVHSNGVELVSFGHFLYFKRDMFHIVMEIDEVWKTIYETADSTKAINLIHLMSDIDTAIVKTADKEYRCIPQNLTFPDSCAFMLPPVYEKKFNVIHERIVIIPFIQTIEVFKPYNE